MLDRKISKGFSLLEIILVVLVLSVVATLSAPMFSKSFESMQIKKSAEDLSFTLRYAQSRAIIKEKTVHLEFSPDSRKYWLTENNQDESDQSSAEKFERISSRMGRETQLPENVFLQLAPEQINFSRDGQIDPVTIYVCAKLKNSQQDKCLTITTKIKRASVDLINEKWVDENE